MRANGWPPHCWAVRKSGWPDRFQVYPSATHSLTFAPVPPENSIVLSTQQKSGLPGVTPPIGQMATSEKITAYHWLVVIIASCGWLFDCMDQRLFVLCRESASRELLKNSPEALAHLKQYGTYATSWMLLGWAAGGIIFGMLSDKIGRVKTMAITLFFYAGFTGLSGCAHNWSEFIAYRFLMGLGVGGMFGAATTLVAETVPGRLRSWALGSLQILSATGNIIGSLITLRIQPGAINLWGNYSGWRVLFFVGVIPALLTLPILFVLREPEAWKLAKAKAAAGQA